MSVNPGKILGILGESGSGKTTLLNIIANRHKNKKLHSQHVTFQHKDSDFIRHNLLSYVMAEDKLLPYLTVLEHFMSVADLRLPFLAKSIRTKRVHCLINNLSLTHCKDRLIGGDWRSGITSGELKRVTLGLELLNNSSVLLLDEPMTGLDSAFSMKIMDILSNEARKGKTIILTLHQPSSMIFSKIDELLLLANGNVLYHGLRENALNYFNTLGYSCSKDWNQSDFLLELATLAKRNNGKIEKSLKLKTAWKNSLECANIENYVQGFKNIAKFIPPPTKKNSSKPATSCYQIPILCERMIKNKMRNPLSLIVILLVQIMQGLILGSIFHRLATASSNKGFDPFITNEAWNDIWLKEYTYGLQENQDKWPMVSMLEQGVDGKNSFIIFDETTKAVDIQKYFLRNIDSLSTCLYKKLDLPSKGYFNLTELIDNPAAASWDEWRPKRIYSNILALYQIFDYKYSSGKTHKPFRFESIKKCKKRLIFWICVYNEIDFHFSEFLACNGLPRFAGGAASAFATNKHTVDPIIPETLILESLLKKQPSNVVLGGQKEFLDEMIPYLLGPNLIQLLDAVKAWVAELKHCTSSTCKQITLTYSFVTSWLDAITQTLLSTFNLGGCLFLIVSAMGFSAYEVLLSFPQERTLFNRDTANKLYTSSSYYIAKNLADLPFQIVPSTAMACIFYLLVGYDPSLTQFLIYFSLSILTAICAYGFGYMVSAASSRMEIALFVAPLTLGMWILLGGFYVKDESMSSYISWMKYFSFYRYSFFAKALNQFPVDQYFGVLPNSITLNIIGVTNQNIYYNVIILICLAILYRLMAYIFLVKTNRNIGLEC